MKQLASIFLIAIFAFSQYAKQFAYIECKIANSISNSAVKCDCEKKYDIHTLNDKAPVSSSAHSHPSLIDEYYAAPADHDINYQLVSILNKSMPLSHSAIAKGINGSPFRPPQV